MEWNAEAILDDVSRATNSLIIDEPFYGHFFVGILKEVHERIQTMAIGPSGHHVKLHINPVFWKTQLVNEKLRMGLVKHEILHVVFKHIFRGHDYAQKDLFNIACDLVVNQYIKTDWLPENRIHLGLFPGIGLEPDRDADEYYRKLSALKERCEQVGDGEGEGIDPADRDAWESLKKIVGAEDEWQAKHGLWVDLDQLPAAMRELLEDQVNAAIKESLEKSRRDSKEWGKLPAGLRQHLQEFERSLRPVVNWRRMLRMFTESSSRTFVRGTMKRASKRYGTTPGIKVHKRQRILVAVDTSASITHADLEDFFGEIFHIWKRGAEIRVVECDITIAAAYTYKGITPADVHGRGGTLFDAPITYANQQFLPDAIVYFTDGFGPLPKVAARMPLLWLLSREGSKAGPEHMERFPGRKVRMHPVD